MRPLTGTSPSVKTNCVFVGGRRRLDYERAALKGVNEEHTGYSRDGLVARAGELVVQTQTRTAQRGSIPFPWTSTVRATRTRRAAAA